MATKSLPERYRRAWSIREGHEIRTLDGEWLLVGHVLRIYAPANIVAFTFVDGSRYTALPNDDVMCRRLNPSVVLPDP